MSKLTSNWNGFCAFKARFIHSCKSNRFRLVWFQWSLHLKSRCRWLNKRQSRCSNLSFFFDQTWRVESFNLELFQLFKTVSCKKIMFSHNCLATKVCRVSKCFSSVLSFSSTMTCFKTRSSNYSVVIFSTKIISPSSRLRAKFPLPSSIFKNSSRWRKIFPACCIHKRRSRSSLSASLVHVSESE